MLMELLTRYWFEFEMTDNDLQRFGYFPAWGIGITAYDYKDALKLLRRWIMREENEFPKLKKVIENVNIPELFPVTSRLPQQLGCSAWRGVWYPAINIWYGPDLQR